MKKMRFLIPLFVFSPLVLMACDPEVADISTELPDDRPDVSGSYTAQVVEAEGCEQEVESLDWMVGALEITGEATLLSLEFVDGDVLGGEVDEAFAIDAEGTVQPGERELDVVFQGVVVLGDDGWDIDGDVVANVFESTGDVIACTLSGRLEAQQIP